MSDAVMAGVGISAGVTGMVAGGAIGNSHANKIIDARTAASAERGLGDAKSIARRSIVGLFTPWGPATNVLAGQGFIDGFKNAGTTMGRIGGYAVAGGALAALAGVGVVALAKSGN